jgi:hypothetical protein
MEDDARVVVAVTVGLDRLAFVVVVVPVGAAVGDVGDNDLDGYCDCCLLESLRTDAMARSRVLLRDAALVGVVAVLLLWVKRPADLDRR